MSFLIDDKGLEMIEYRRIMYSVFMDDKNIYPMRYNRSEDLFYFVVNMTKENQKTMIAFPTKMWYKLKTHFEPDSQAIVEAFIVEAIKKD